MPRSPSLAAAGGLPETQEITGLRPTTKQVVRRSRKSQRPDVLKNQPQKTGPLSTVSKECLVGLLADEQSRLVRAYGRLDDAERSTSRERCALEERIAALETCASFLPAQSALGALFQCYLMFDLVGLDQTVEIRDRLERMILSLHDFVKKLTGVNGDRDLAIHYVGGADSQFHGMISAALAEETTHGA